MVCALREEDAITSDAVAAAFAAVPRHLFAPAADLATGYSLHKTVPVKKDSSGADLSVMSAAHLQGVMLEQAQVEPGMNVLEIGSGGVNAAMLQELVGRDGGTVTTVDIDRDVVDQAGRCLTAAGYDRVRVVLADAERGVDGGPFDRIIVTFGAWDIAPTWLSSLVRHGRLIVPLRLRGLTRSVAFVRDGDGLVSTSYRLARFVPAQGDGAFKERKVMMREGVAVQTDDPNIHLDGMALDQALDTPRLEAWSGEAYDLPDELELYLATNLSSPVRLHASDAVIGQGVVEASAKLGVPALVGRESIVYRTRRENEATGGFESGVIAHGPEAQSLVEQYVYLLQRWARDHRRRGAAQFRYLPTAAAPAALLQEPGTVAKHHGVVTVSWHQSPGVDGRGATTRPPRNP
jgi:protein-L-isoaspartate(D-aspartate) O-methyltransferase